VTENLVAAVGLVQNCLGRLRNKIDLLLNFIIYVEHVAIILNDCLRYQFKNYTIGSLNHTFYRTKVNMQRRDTDITRVRNEEWPHRDSSNGINLSPS